MMAMAAAIDLFSVGTDLPTAFAMQLSNIKRTDLPTAFAMQ